MLETAEFRSSTRRGNLGLGLGMLALTGCIFYVAVFGNEEMFLGAEIRRGGIFKVVEQTIGWPAFALLLAAFGIWCLIQSVVGLWKVVVPVPEVTALEERMEFHPAVKRRAAAYDEISHWWIEIVQGHPVLWIQFVEPFWSLNGLFKRKALKLEGGREQLTPLADFLGAHPIMGGKYVAR